MSFPVNFSSFEEYKDTLAKEPSDSEVEKEYVLTFNSQVEKTAIVNLLSDENSDEPLIPSRSVSAWNEHRNSSRRYGPILTATEAQQLQNHELVAGCEVNAAAYPGTYFVDPDDVAYVERTRRYNEPVTHGRVQDSTWCPVSNPPASSFNRSGYQQLRHQQLQNPPTWQANEYTEIQDIGSHYGTGRDVDCIVCDDNCWFGHIEFQNHLGISTISRSEVPVDYEGGNVFSRKGISNGWGTCDLLELVLDGPYYLDQAFFDADTANRLTTRWDGTTVPVESVARAWWSTNQLTARSSKFVSPAYGGTATGDDDFGTIAVPSGYTRASVCGDNQSYPTGGGRHGTPCASQVYGRQYGWAYNANKWYLNMFGTNNAGYAAGHDFQTVFHKVKPVNPAYGTKDPTVSSNSWGHRYTPPTNNYWFYRTGTTGAVNGVFYSNKPNLASNFYGNQRMAPYLKTDSHVVAGDELIDSGVIFLCAGGNHTQKMVYSDHPDYDNYSGGSQNTALSSSTGYSGYTGTYFYMTYNRIGYPQQIGATYTNNDQIAGDQTVKTIIIGALDNIDHSTTSKECQVNYSNKGEAVDCYAAAHYTMSAMSQDSYYYTEYDRVDGYYMLNGVTSAKCRDTRFSGTSSATPVAAGIVATKMEYNRSWNYVDVKNWVKSCGIVTSTEFYYGQESGSLDDTNWLDDYTLENPNGPTVIWDKLTGSEPISKMNVTGAGLKFTGVPIGITTA